MENLYVRKSIITFVVYKLFNTMRLIQELWKITS